MLVLKVGDRSSRLRDGPANQPIKPSLCRLLARAGADVDGQPAAGQPSPADSPQRPAGTASAVARAHATVGLGGHDLWCTGGFLAALTAAMADAVMQAEVCTDCIWLCASLRHLTAGCAPADMALSYASAFLCFLCYLPCKPWSRMQLLTCSHHGSVRHTAFNLAQFVQVHCTERGRAFASIWNLYTAATNTTVGMLTPCHPIMHSLDF